MTVDQPILARDVVTTTSSTSSVFNSRGVASTLKEPLRLAGLHSPPFVSQVSGLFTNTVTGTDLASGTGIPTRLWARRSAPDFGVVARVGFG